MWKCSKTFVIQKSKSDIKDIIFDNQRCMIEVKFNKHFVSEITDMNYSVKFESVTFENLNVVLTIKCKFG